jgi:hypothetical protein
MSASLPLFAEPALTLPALSLWQPFASLVVDGAKSVETRLSATKFRGRFVVCATKALAPSKLYKATLERLVAAGEDPDAYAPKNVQRGVVLGIVELVDCRPMTEADEPKAWVSRFTDAGELRWAWLLSQRIVRLKPAPVEGRQFWFRVPASLCVPEAA